MLPAIAVLCVLLLLFLLLGLFCFLLVCARYGGPLYGRLPSRDPDLFSERLSEWQHVIDEGERWISAQPWEEWTLSSRDGLRLCGRYLPAPDAKQIFLCAHGYRSSADRDFSAAARPLYAMGTSLLLIDQRAHGLSEGKYITLGVRESQDIADWAAALAQRTSSDLPIYLDGISMGAASVLMSGSSPLPDRVAGVIADCGYASADAELRYVLEGRMRVPSFPLLWLIRLWGRVLAGVDLAASSAVAGAGAMGVPVLFVHGEDDTVVPSEMTQDAFRACRAPKDILLVPGAEHGLSYLVDPEGYTAKLRSLLRAGQAAFAEHREKA